MEEVNVGDKIIIEDYSFHKDVAIVEKVTKTLVIAGGFRFNKKDGFQHTSSLYKRRALVYSPNLMVEIEREIIRNKKIEKCKQIKFDNLTDSQLDYILEVANK